MSPALYISFAISPILIIIGMIVLGVTFKVKNWTNIRNAIILGFFSVVLIVIANYLIDLRWHGEYGRMKRMVFVVFIAIAFSAEIAKYIALLLGFYHRKNFEGPIEGIIYSNFIGLGYSTVAVVLFAYSIIVSPRINDFTLFLYLYPIANLVFSTCMGFFVGMGKLRKNVLIDHATGIFVATFFHGLFYFSFVTSDVRLQILTGAGMILIGVIFLMRAIKLRKMKDD